MSSQIFLRLLLVLGLCAGSARLTAKTPEIQRAERAPATAALIPLSDNWRLDGDVPAHATLLSLQGLANRAGPQIYLQYPADWQWEIAGPLIDFLHDRHGIEWQRYESGDLDTPLRDFGHVAKGVVVWDKDVRSSLIVAFTIAGVEDLLVVNEDQLDLAARHGLEIKKDLRGQFTGQGDADIYQWAYDEYYERCSRDFYTVLGGHHGINMQPGVADFGVQQRAFFSDLSANPKHPRELALLNKVLAGQNPASVVLGWHSYGKDTEGQHTTLTGSYGLRMEGLHNLPNVSFTSQIPLTPDFTYETNHTVEPDAELVPEEKVYVAALATDSMGIGAWTKPGRGRIPYGWQVLMNWSWMNPPALQFFYESKTPNDYFVGGLSGPGYMYPKSVPEDKFRLLMADARELMETLDLRVMEIMDYSQGNRHVGNTDLDKRTVDLYYEEFPDVLGFINGYGTARTFDLRGDQPMLSYDYYLGVERPTEEAAADLEELIRLNPGRPYFLLMHVRERTTIEQVANILDNLSDSVEVVPLDRFLRLAAAAKTYRTRYQQPEDPIDHNP
ncbi:GxGYxYP domain-containing protein [Actomonas aquatica]|uniref:GxGYxYP family putative glycoside hydrolase n=1 Tax=Actomonas aquatica TaxID=2866162 RepID=A0ABZ1C3E1_9BACT|nr:GxGYxYP domain-containing protein [Opitutus sp. WL0086]WRQ86059.1 GxGYxYP family putative glycoside hydrolase [Opitutus sp. WL0086]